MRSEPKCRYCSTSPAVYSALVEDYVCLPCLTSEAYKAYQQDVEQRVEPEPDSFKFSDYYVG